MSKKRLGGRRPYWPNHGKSCVIFPPFPPTTPNLEFAVPTLEINGRSNFDLLQQQAISTPKTSLEKAALERSIRDSWKNIRR
jgi:hypothetical protein